MKKLLIIYYSWSNGNTERIAKMLQSETVQIPAHLTMHSAMN